MTGPGPSLFSFAGERFFLKMKLYADPLQNHHASGEEQHQEKYDGQQRSPGNRLVESCRSQADAAVGEGKGIKGQLETPGNLSQREESPAQEGHGQEYETAECGQILV